MCNCGHGLERFCPASEKRSCKFKQDGLGAIWPVYEDVWMCKYGCGPAQMDATKVLAEAYLKLAENKP